MADKVKSQKDKYLDLLEQAYDAAGSKSGVNMSMDEIDSLFTDLYNTDPTKLNQWLALNKGKLENIPEIAALPGFISVTEDPKVVEKDYGFTESEDFYKMDGTKSWMNKSIAYLQNNADKYGLTLGEYLDKVRELSTSKDRESQWEDNAATKKFENVPAIGDVNIPGLTAAMLPTSFNKAAMGKEVTAGDIAYDIVTDEIEGALATLPTAGYAWTKYTGPVQAALLGNVARQGKGLYDGTQDEFSKSQAVGAGLTGALGTPLVTKAAGDLLKRGAGFVGGLKPVGKVAGYIEDIGNEAPSDILKSRMDQLNAQVARTERADKFKFDNFQYGLGKLSKEVNELIEKTTPNHPDLPGLKKFADNILDEYKEFNPTKTERQIYGTGSKLWRNVKTGEILTDEQLKKAKDLLTEYKRGPDYQPTPKNVLQNQYERALRIKNMPEGELLVNAWAEPMVLRKLRNAGKDISAMAGGRLGTGISEDDKKEMAKNIIKSTEWGKYVTGLPNNLTDEQIYIATVYGE